MSKLAHARSFRDLVVYEKARAIARRLFEVSVEFPREEMYSLTDQLRRCSRSVGAQIAEAWAKRRYCRHFVSKLTDADAEQHETQYWIEVSCDCGYIGHKQTVEFLCALGEIGRMLGAMINKAEWFCGDVRVAMPASASDAPAAFQADAADRPPNLDTSN